MFKSILFDVYLYLAYRSIWFNKQNRFCWHNYVSDICSSSQLPVVKVTAFSVETFISQIHAVHSRFLVVTVRDFCWHIYFSDTLSYWLLKKSRYCQTSFSDRRYSAVGSEFLAYINTPRTTAPWTQPEYLVGNVVFKVFCIYLGVVISVRLSSLHFVDSVNAMSILKGI